MSKMVEESEKQRQLNLNLIEENRSKGLRYVNIFSDDKVICPICGKDFRRMKKHFTSKKPHGHNISEEDFKAYVKAHPEILMTCENSRKNRSELTTSRMLVLWKNPKWRTNQISALTNQETSNKRSKSRLKYIAKNPEKAHNDAIKAGQLGGRRTHELHPGLASRMSKRAHELDPGLARRAGKIGGKIGGKRSHELHPDLASRMGQAACKTNREKKPYWWGDTQFGSEEECQVAHKILRRPINGVNCQVQVGSKTVDFYPCWDDKLFQNSLVEYHPFDMNNRTLMQYYHERRNAADNNGHAGVPLIILKGEWYKTYVKGCEN